MLGSKRIGHGYALSKHPVLLKMVKERDIAVEVNPISNQVMKNIRNWKEFVDWPEEINKTVFLLEKVLKLVDDIRNHPAAVYFSQNIPLIISSGTYSNHFELIKFSNGENIFFYFFLSNRRSIILGSITAVTWLLYGILRHCIAT